MSQSSASYTADEGWERRREQLPKWVALNSSQMAQYNLILRAIPIFSFYHLQYAIVEGKVLGFLVRKGSHSILLYLKLLPLAVFRSGSVLFFFTAKAQQSSSDSCLHCALFMHIYTNYFLSLHFCMNFTGHSQILPGHRPGYA